ncbi:sialidase family protein [Fodinicola feengrottensis]|uniref:sialidase family protein n=1 Tax=Fodinicola feengrottensis TaxID=435914 RepID=UPI0013D3B1F5|nr:sialidase family protein [Fodinicola feengrottensis]
MLAADTVVIGSMITHDGGTTWTPAGQGGKVAPVDNAPYGDQVLAVGSPVRTVPKNWPMRIRYVAGAKLPSLDAVDPNTDVDHPLTTQPTTQPYNVKRAADGSLWVIGSRSQGVTDMQVSHDSGASWTNASVDDGMTNGYQEFATRDGQTAYLLGAPDSPRANSNQQVPIGLRVSHDGGKTWGARTPIGSGVSEMQNLVVLADGSLVGAGSVVNGQSAQWQMLRSTDGGRTFSKIATLPADPSTTGVGAQLPTGGPVTALPNGGYVFRTNGDAAKGAVPATMVSADGLTWKAVRQPPIK